MTTSGESESDDSEMGRLQGMFALFLYHSFSKDNVCEDKVIICSVIRKKSVLSVMLVFFFVQISSLNR